MSAHSICLTAAELIDQWRAGITMQAHPTHPSHGLTANSSQQSSRVRAPIESPVGLFVGKVIGQCPAWSVARPSESPQRRRPHSFRCRLSERALIRACGSPPALSATPSLRWWAGQPRRFRAPRARPSRRPRWAEWLDRRKAPPRPRGRGAAAPRPCCASRT
eukprot:scaffold20180_cov116-Isochrysis_galbana.AAC.4